MTSLNEARPNLWSLGMTYKVWAEEGGRARVQGRGARCGRELDEAVERQQENQSVSQSINQSQLRTIGSNTQRVGQQGKGRRKSPFALVDNDKGSRYIAVYALEASAIGNTEARRGA